MGKDRRGDLLAVGVQEKGGHFASEVWEPSPFPGTKDLSGSLFVKH